MATPEDAARFIALESDDYDGLGGANGYGWARSTTDDVARGIGVTTEEAYRLLKAGAKKGLVYQDAFRRKGVSTGRFGSSQVGWAIWEVHLTRAQTIERDGSAGEPDEKAVGFHRSALLDDFVRGEQVTGKTMVRAAEECGVDLDPALKRALNKPGIWVRPLTSNLSSDAMSAQACAIYGTLRQSGDQSLVPNTSHYVWVLPPRSNTPLSGEGPFGPYSRSVADQFARIGAKEGIHDRAVSLGKDPEARGFEIERRYAARTGARLI